MKKPAVLFTACICLVASLAVKCDSAEIASVEPPAGTTEPAAVHSPTLGLDTTSIQNMTLEQLMNLPIGPEPARTGEN